MHHFTLRRLVLLAVCLTAAHATLLAEPPSENLRLIEEIEYGNVDGHSLLLNLYAPKNVSEKAPLVVWIHGGGWNKGSKNKCPIAWLCDEGFAVASVDYRLTDKAQWPAQIEDCRAAVAYLRREHETLGLAVERIGVAGSSAGGHLVALMGTLDQSEEDERKSGVQAVCDFFGPTDLLTMPNNVLSEGKTEADLAKVNGARLLGGIVRNMPERAKQASALHHVSANDPPTLIIHGDADPMVPITQSERFHNKLVAAGCDSTLYVVKGGGHGMKKQFQTPEMRERIVKFFAKHIAETQVGEQEPVKHLFGAKLLLRRLEPLELAPEQMTKFNQLSRELRAKVDRIRLEAGITKEMIKARDKAFSAAKESGLAGADLWRSVQSEVGLTDKQRDTFKHAKGLSTEFRESVTKMLTDEQRKTFRKSKKRKSE